MLQENLNCQDELRTLIVELDDISSDLAQYLNFLIERRSLIQQVLTDGPASNN